MSCGISTSENASTSSFVTVVLVIRTFSDGAIIKISSAPGSLCNVSQTAEYRAHLVCSVHVHICTQKSLYRVNDNQPCAVFPDCPCYALIGKGQRCVPIVNDKHSFKVCVSFHQPGLNGIAQTVLGGLIDDIKRLNCFHTGQGLSVGASRRKTHGKVGLSLAGVALYDRQLSKGDIRKP